MPCYSLCESQFGQVHQISVEFALASMRICTKISCTDSFISEDSFFSDATLQSNWIYLISNFHFQSNRHFISVRPVCQSTYLRSIQNENSYQSIMFVIVHACMLEEYVFISNALHIDNTNLPKFIRHIYHSQDSFLSISIRWVLKCPLEQR